MRYILFLLVCSPAFLFAQNMRQQLDAIQQLDEAIDRIEAYQSLLSKNPKTDIRLRILMPLCKEYQNENAGKLFVQHCDQGIRLAENQGADSLLAYFIKIYASFQVTNRNLDIAVENFKRAAKIAYRGGFKQLEASCYNNIGGMLIDLDRFEEAGSYLLKSIKYSDGPSPTELRNKMYSTRLLATLYTRTKNPKAEELFIKLLNDTKKFGDTILCVSNLVFYGEFLYDNNRYDEALNYLDEAHSIIANTTDLGSLSATLSLKARVLKKLNRHEETSDLLYQILTINSQLHQKESQQQLNAYEKKLRVREERQKRQKAEVEKTIVEKNNTLLTYGILISIFIALSLILFILLRSQYKKRIHLDQLKNERFANLIEGEEKERGRIARELHDGIVQDLTALQINLRLKNKEEPGDLGNIINEVRGLTHQMVPFFLEEHGLIQALRDLFKRSLNPLNISFNIESFGEFDSLKKSVILSLYRISQELVNNSVKHGNPKQINCLIRSSHTSLIFLYEDDGDGMKKNVKSGIGLDNLKTRVDSLNGKLTIESEPLVGTRVQIVIPK